jgi:predicted deacylase
LPIVLRSIMVGPIVVTGPSSHLPHQTEESRLSLRRDQFGSGPLRLALGLSLIGSLLGVPFAQSAESQRPPIDAAQIARAVAPADIAREPRANTDKNELVDPPSDAGTDTAPPPDQPADPEAATNDDSEINNDNAQLSDETARDQESAAAEDTSDPEEAEGSEEWGPVELLGELVYPGAVRRLSMPLSESLDGAEVPIPVIAYRGLLPGPTLCVTAGIHGDEVNGVEVARRIIDEVNTDLERGMILSVPIVNLSAVRRASRYLPDRRDLNRYFPGRRYGSSASRIAYHFFENVIRECNILIDIHTGSFNRSNLHQLRAELSVPAVLEIAEGLGSPIVVNNAGRKGTLRGAAVAAGIAAVTIEAGEPIRLSIKEVETAVREIRRLMVVLRMLKMEPETELKQAEQELYYQSHWVRAVAGGILVNQVKLGDIVEKDVEIASVTDPMTSVRYSIFSPYSGKVIGLAFDQLVMPGFAIAHVAVPTNKEREEEPESLTQATPPVIDVPDAEATEGAHSAASEENADDAALATDEPGDLPDEGLRGKPKGPQADLGARPE